LTGQWCQTGEYRGGGDYIRAKNFCKETRPTIFTIHKLGFWIKLANVKAQIMCVPREVENFAHGWTVVADCGADDLSTKVYRSGFTFEFEGSATNKMAISRWTPQSTTPPTGPKPARHRTFQREYRHLLITAPTTRPRRWCACARASRCQAIGSQARR